MAASSLSCKISCVAFVCFIFFGLLAAQVTNQLPRNSTIDGPALSFFLYQNPEYPRDCKEIRDSCPSSVSSGVYLIKPDGYNEPFEAYCDNDSDSGGWTVILRRLNGSVDFNRNWSEYKKGFGFLSAELWLGNDKLSYLTNQAQYEIRIDITLDNGTSCNVRYNASRISDEWGDYTITSAGTYQSDAGCKWEEEGNSRPTEVSTRFIDCNDVYNAGNTQDGVYSIYPEGWTGSPFDVYCSMSIDGGKWTVFQRRVNDATDFYRNWSDYRDGFGYIQNNFWLGNEKLYYLTQQATYEVRVDFESSFAPYFNKYTSFRIDNEDNKYRVTDLGSHSGTFGSNSLYDIHNRAFSTYDRDNDDRSSSDCAEGHRSGWWHGGCYYEYNRDHCLYFPEGSGHRICSTANFNGDYNGGNGKNIFVNSDTCHIYYVELKIRRTS